MSIEVLRYLDVLIGLALVMLLACSVTSTATHLISSAFLLRAQYLQQGLADIVQMLDPTLTAEDSARIARLLVRHPLLARPATLPGLVWHKLTGGDVKTSDWIPSGSPASTMLRHEFVRILLEWSSGEGMFGQRKEIAHYTERLRNALAANGVASPGDVLRNIRLQTLMQERGNPTQASHLWHTNAMIDSCPSELVAKVTTWYDSMSNRTSERFKYQSQILSSIAALIVVIALPLDSIALVKRLSVDEELRKSLVAQAQKVVDTATAAPAVQQPSAEVAQAKEDLTFLNSPRLGLTTTTDHWAALPGIILSWVLISLGTPFWYDVLKNTLRFRSLVAQKDDKERSDRQQDTSTSPGAAATTPALPVPKATVTVAAQPVAVDDESGDDSDVMAVG